MIIPVALTAEDRVRGSGIVLYVTLIAMYVVVIINNATVTPPPHHESHRWIICRSNRFMFPADWEGARIRWDYFPLCPAGNR